MSETDYDKVVWGWDDLRVEVRNAPCEDAQQRRVVVTEGQGGRMGFVHRALMARE